MADVVTSVQAEAGSLLALRRPVRRMGHNAFAWLLVAPALLFILVTVAWPLAETVRLRFTDADLGGEPRVFLFDERLSKLDAALRGDMRVGLSQLHRSLQATMVYVTHDQVEVITMAGRIAVLNRGRVEQFGTPMELYHHPVSRVVATFIGQPNMNLLPATVRGQDAAGLAVEIDGGSVLTLPVEPGGARAGDRIDAGIRPENLHLGESGAGLAMPERVLERLGGASITHGRIGPVPACAALPGDAAIEEGATLHLRLDSCGAHAFDAQGRVQHRPMAPALVA